MSETLEAVRQLVAIGDVRISEHGFDELSEDDISIRDLLSGIQSATAIEDYPALPKGYTSPAVLVTAYRPDLARWNENFTERR